MSTFATGGPLVVGIDPGLEGALSAVCALWCKVWDTPTFEQNGKRVYDVRSMAGMFEYVDRPALVVLEKVNAFPGQGVTSMFKLGYGLGLWVGVISALGLPLELVTPQRWKGAMLDGTQRDKTASLIRARELFPTAVLDLKKHHGRAEALLLAEYGRRTKVG